MPYIQVDLDAKKKFPLVARGLKIDLGSVALGFLDLWEPCFGGRCDTVSVLQLECLFSAPGDRVSTVLVELGFLEPKPDGSFRIRGSSRYESARTARSRGGKSAVSNLMRGPKKPPAAAGSQPGVSRESAGAEPRLLSRESRVESREEEEEEEAASEKSLAVASATSRPLETEGQNRAQTPTLALHGPEGNPTADELFEKFWEQREQLKLKPTKAEKPPRKSTIQERFAEWFEEQRKEELGDKWSPDVQLAPARLNKELSFVKDLTEDEQDEISRAATAYLIDPKRWAQDPPCRLDFFTRDYPEYISKVRRTQ